MAPRVDPARTATRSASSNAFAHAASSAASAHRSWRDFNASGPPCPRTKSAGREVESVDELLGHHARDGDHGDASVVELPELHVVEPRLGFSAGEPERVEAVVAGHVLGLEEEELVRVEGVLPGVLHAK